MNEPFSHQFDFARWLQRASDFIDTIRQRPGSSTVECETDAPLSASEVAEVSKRIRRPIPLTLQQWWTTACASCRLSYRWELPKHLHAQHAICSGEDLDEIWGGPEFLSPSEVMTECELIEDIREDFLSPKDARFWNSSIPLIPLGTGDYLGLYVGDELDDPPVAFLSHEHCGASGIISESFTTFLRDWELVGYVGLDGLFTFVDRRTERFAPMTFETERAALTALLAGEERHDLQARDRRLLSRTDWTSMDKPGLLLDCLDAMGQLDSRKQRLLACAFCRRYFEHMTASTHQAVEFSERFAEGLVTEAELYEFKKRLYNSVDEIRGGEGLSSIDKAALAALEGNVRDALFQIERVLDEPELSRERRLLASSVRQVFGDPFQLYANADSSRPFFGSIESLRRIALGLFGYEERHGFWPRYAIFDSAGNPLLSWRVAILPFLGEEQLFGRVALDEAWDSDANRKLWDEVPLVFRPHRTTAATETHIMAVVGDHTMWPREGMRHYTDVSSGTSYTIALVEAGHRSTNWMRPDDISFAEFLDTDRSSLSGLHGGKSFAVCMVDGNAQLIHATISPTSLRDSISIE